MRNLRVKELKPAAEVAPGKLRYFTADLAAKKLRFVDETNASGAWEAALAEPSFDLVCCNLDRLVVAQRHGCRVYCLNQLNLEREIADAAHVRNATSALLAADGRVWVLDGTAVHEYDAQGAWAHTWAFGETLVGARALRFTAAGTVLAGTVELQLDRGRTPAACVVRRDVPAAAVPTTTLILE